MRKPAVIVCPDSRCALEVAVLTVLDRLVVALHRAECGPLTIVTRQPLPDLQRTRALGIPLELRETADVARTDVLLARGHLLIQTADILEALRTGEDLVTADGNELLLRHVSAGAPVVMPERCDGGGVRARGVACYLHSEAQAQESAQALWASLKSSSDGTVDKYFNRPCGRPLSRLLIHTPVTPNQISLASIVIGLVAAWGLARGDFASAVGGALAFQLSAIIDCVDGDVARMVFKESRLGKWLDIVGDQVVHVGVFIGIALGLARAGSAAPVGWLAASAVVGASVSFAVVVRGMFSDGLKRSSRWQALIDRATNRDFSVVVLALALLQSLHWFLWMAAIGSHLFWLAAWFLQGQTPSVATTSVESRR